MSAIADLIADPATPDDALARAAASAAAGELEALLRDEARLLRHPAIVAALFANPQAPMAVVNRAVAVCVRGGVRVDGIPGFDDVAAVVDEHDADLPVHEPTLFFSTREINREQTVLLRDELHVRASRGRPPRRRGRAARSA